MNIFSGTEPPQWLQQRAEADSNAALRNAEQLGSLMGTAFAAATDWATRDPDTVDPLTNTKGRQSFWTNFQEARENQANPMWALQAQQQRQQILGNAAKLEQQKITSAEMADEFQAQREDAPKVIPWLRKPDWDNPPEARSQKWMSTVQKAQQMHDMGEYRKQMAEAAKTRADNAIKAQELKNKEDELKRLSREKVVDEQLKALQGRVETVVKGRETVADINTKSKEDIASEKAKATQEKSARDERLKQIHTDIADLNKKIASAATDDDRMELKRQKVILQGKAMRLARGQGEEAKPQTPPAQADSTPPQDADNPLGLTRKPQ
jgi:hypothetical protein